jgi:hypothetical protein
MQMWTGQNVRINPTTELFVIYLNPALMRNEPLLVTQIVSVASVTVTPTANSLPTGSTVQMTAVARDASNNIITGLPVTWSTTPAGVGSISATGLFTSTGAGTATVTATIGGVGGNTTINVSNTLSIGSVSVALGSSTVAGNATTTATATVRDGGNNVVTSPVTWTSSNFRVARVNPDGTVQALGAGTTTITASAGGKSGNATLTVNAAPQSFNIVMRYVTTPSAPVQAAFDAAAQRWMQVIRGDLADIPLSGMDVSSCLGKPAGTVSLTETVDDIVIYADVRPIDGVGGVNNQSGPCLVRNNGGLTLVGTMRFDVADIAAMQANNTLTPVVMHEMAHVLGFGTAWKSSVFPTASTFGIDPEGDPVFVGANAMWAFQNMGIAYGGSIVPVENSGGAGIRNIHWRESVLQRELMTGTITAGGGVNSLSPLTVASFADIGYVVDLSQTDAQPWSLRAGIVAAGSNNHLNEIVMTDPMAVDSRGRIVGRTSRAPVVPPPLPRRYIARAASAVR